MMSSLLRPYDEDVLDFGAGIGTLAKIWREQVGIKPECVEIDPKQVTVIKKRGFVCFNSIKDVNKRYDLVYSSNVFEHIENDIEMLSDLKAFIKPGGILAIYVPAFDILYSNFDSHAGHYRRYSRKEMNEKLVKAGYRVLKSNYSDSIGFFLWLIIKFFNKKNESQLVNDRSLVVFDKIVYPFSKVLDLIGFKHFFGKNLIVLATLK
jgi:SAM-dependent methyltransferase